jgi:ribosome biogenesis GTPase
VTGGTDAAPGVELLPRTSLLVRGSASGESRSQPLAANVDHVLVCASLSGSLPVRRIERLLTLAWDSGATPVVVLTKADLHDDPVAAVEALRPHAPGCPIVTVTAAAGDVDALAPWSRPGATLVLLGASGTGKSTVVNALAGHEVMGTGEVRDVDGKGRHTTTHRELVVLPSGPSSSTPRAAGRRAGRHVRGPVAGVRRRRGPRGRVPLRRLRPPRRAGVRRAGQPDAGDLTEERLDSWRRLQRELAWQARRTDARLQAEEKARWKAVHKARRGQVWRP